MYIKLNFTSDKLLTDIYPIIHTIINNSQINSIASLTQFWINNSFNSTYINGLDSSNSQLFRTADSSKVKSHFRNPSNNTASHMWTMEFESYDDVNQKYYVQFNNNSSPTSLFSSHNVGTGISGGTIDSLSFSLENYLTSATGGTALTLVNSSSTDNLTIVSGAAFSNVRTYWCYITNNCIIWATTNTTTFTTGFGTTYSNISNYSGPYIISQYTRFDNHNNSGNQVVPVIYVNPRRSPIGASNSDVLGIANTGFTTNNTTLPFYVVNMVDAYNQSSGYPVVFHQPVALTLGGRSSNMLTLNAQTSLTTTGANTVQSGASVITNLSARRPAANAIDSGFGLITLGWEELFRGNHGGNISEKSKVYLFNAEYIPGDEFVLDDVTWQIWPLFSGNGLRLGLAIPKE
jgi:hypothetical protein